MESNDPATTPSSSNTPGRSTMSSDKATTGTHSGKKTRTPVIADGSNYSPNIRRPWSTGFTPHDSKTINSSSYHAIPPKMSGKEVDANAKKAFQAYGTQPSMSREQVDAKAKESFQAYGAAAYPSMSRDEVDAKAKESFQAYGAAAYPSMTSNYQGWGAYGAQPNVGVS